MNERLQRLRHETAQLQKVKRSDSEYSSGREGKSSQNSSSHMSPRSTNASQVASAETHNSLKSSQVEFYKSETSFKNLTGNQEYDRQPSLAESLRHRREFNDLMVKEREALGSSQLGKLIQGKNKVIVKETDMTGSAIRIRPQRQQNLGRPETPKLNLLELQQRRQQAMNKVNISEKKPFNYLNPYQNLANLPLRQQPSVCGSMVIPQHKLLVVSQNEPTFLEKDDFEPHESPPIKQDSFPDSNTNGQLSLFNMQDQFFEILEQNEVGDVMDLNEKFLSMALGGIEVHELATLPKIELRVDTSCHNLQVTGEILTSLEYLKLNDSVIRCFRDIGTSFKNVKVLHIARCEISEVQGIQAFESLEELYISFNQIGDLFDISFLENLRVLDLEGNNVKENGQMYYLRRLTQLIDVNFKHNPIEASIDYKKLVRENCPQLQVLDDGTVESTQPQVQVQKKQHQLGNESSLMRFLKLGIDQLETLCQEAYDQVLKEPGDEELLITTIKNKNREQKAKQSYEQNVKFFERQQSQFGISNDDSDGLPSEEMDPENVMRASRISFFKTSQAGRLTTNNFFKRQNTDESRSNSSTSELISNTNHAYAGGSMSILRNKVIKLNQSGLGPKKLSNDIQSLMADYYQDAETYKEENQKKIGRPQLKVKPIRLSSAKKQRSDSSQKTEVKKVAETNTEAIRDSLNQFQQIRNSIKIGAAPVKIKLLSKDGVGALNKSIKANRILFKTDEKKI